jgi:hypothetical protein
MIDELSIGRPMWSRVLFEKKIRENLSVSQRRFKDAVEEKQIKIPFGRGNVVQEYFPVGPFDGASHDGIFNFLEEFVGLVMVDELSHAVPLGGLG